MRDKEKSKAQLIKDLNALRKQVNEFEDIQVERNKVEKNISERKRAEQSLLESEERYRTLSESAFEGMIISENGKVVMANQAFADMFGYDSHEVIGVSPVEMTTPESAKIIMKNIQSGHEKSYEIIGVKKDSSTFNLEIIGKDCLYKGRKARVAAVRDITDRKKGEDALRESESKFRVLAEATSAAIFIFQRNRMRYVNPAASNITGYIQEELLKMNFWEVIHPDFRNLNKKRGLAKRKGGKIPSRHEVKIQTKQGEERWVDFTWSASEFKQKPAVLGTAVDITERKRAEEQLAGLKNFYEQLLEHLPIQLAVLDKDFSYKYLNPHSIKDPLVRKWMIGKTDLDYCRKRGLDLKIGRQRQTWFKDVISSKKSSSYEEVLQTSSGEERHFLRVASPVMGPDGDVIKIVGYGVDITENKLAEKELEKSLSLVRSTLESTADGILVVDEEGKIVSFNQKFLEMWHIPDSIIASRDDKEAITFVLNQLKDPKKFQTHVKRLYSEPEAKSFDVLNFKDDRVFERYSVAQRIGDKIVGRVWSFRDVTERQQTQNALRKSEERLRLTLNAARMGTWEWNTLTNDIFWSDHVKSIFGLNPDVAGGTYQDYLGLVHPQDLDRVVENIDLALKDVELGNKFHIEYRIKRPNGEIHWLEGQGKVFRDENQKPIRMLGTVLNITERKQIEAQLLQSQKMETIGTLAGGVAHDFNNILTAIVGNAELGMQSLDPDHRSYDDLFEIKKAAIKASDLTNQLLSFSRRQLLKKQSFDLNKVVEDLLKMLKRILGEDIELKTELAPGLPRIFADKGQIHQVLMNLCTNARDAMPNGGKLFLETRFLRTGQLPELQNGNRVNNKTYLQLSVTDTGIGMDRELKAHIFEPFFTTKKLGKGTGLGLAVVYGIVKQHNGYLKVESEIYKGTTFKIFLPASTKEQDMGLEVKNRLNTSQGGSETILIVEDEEIVRNVAVRLVNGLGYKVLLAKNGEEAMEVFNRERNSLDLVVMDVVMPKESGPEVYKKMNCINPKLPVLFVTGYDAESKVSSLTRGLNQALIALLQKPYSKEILGRKIRELLDK